MKKTISIDIFFNDLNDKAKAELLDAVRAKDAKEMNWDIDILPLATLDFEMEDENADELEDEL